MKVFFILGLLFFLIIPLWSLDLGVKNQEKDKVFYYWILSLQEPYQDKEFVQELPKAAGGRQMLLPGEKQKIIIQAGQVFLGTFVSWKEELNFRTEVQGTYLLQNEFPKGKIVLLDEKGFLKHHSDRNLSFALQDLGIPVPQFVLDGEFDDWKKVEPAAIFSKLYLPRAITGKNNAEVPCRVKSFSAQLSDQNLWMDIRADDLGKKNYSFLWKMSAEKDQQFLLEASLAGQNEGSVWLWKAGKPLDVGRWKAGKSEIEVCIPLYRLGYTGDWSQVEIDFSELSRGSSAQNLWSYLNFKLEELP